MSNNFDWSFNLSYSTYSTFKQSPLQFYFAKIVGAEPDTETYEIYGKLGNIVHNTVEEYIKNKRLGMPFDYKDNFNKLWDEFKIDDLKTINNHKVKKSDWFKHLENTVFFVDNYKLLNSDDVSVVVEEHLEYVDDDGLLVKGFVDVVIRNKVTGEVVFLDWKTNSSYSEEMHRGQRLFYSWMYYNIHGVIPKCVWVYVKGGKKYEDIFTADDIKEFSEEINGFKEFIIKNHDNIDAFEVGDYNSPFNEYKQACYDEYIRRNKEKVVEVIIKNNTLFFEEGGLPDNLVNIMDKKYSYFVEGYNFSEKFKKRLWDGKKHLFNFKKNTLPIGFIHSVQTLIDDYNNYYDSGIKLKFVDERDKKVLGKKFNTKFLESKLEFRDYQVDSYNKILDKKIGIINLATGLGKTAVASEIIRGVNNRVLFLINRVDLVEQTAEVFREELGVEIGVMSEGNLSVNNQITVGSVQTVYSILKNRDEDKKLLLKYLYNVNTVIYDECHGVSDSSFYDILRRTLLNVEYIIGLTGTAFRNDGSTLEMNGFVGLPVVVYDTKYGEDNGYLCPTKCYFIRHDSIQVDKGSSYPENYSKFVVNNSYRNVLNELIVKKHEGDKILIITKSIEHAFILQEMLPGSEVVNSSVDMKKRKGTMKKFRSEDGFILIAGVKIVGTGLNVPDLNVIINCCANKSDNDTIQVIGRVKRKFKGKEFGYYYDFADRGFLFKATNHRVKILREFGNEVEYIHPDNIK